MPDGSITGWIQGIKNGDVDAARNLVTMFLPSLQNIARQKLGGINRVPLDEEDAALSALKSFLVGVRDNKFAELDNREDLWNILFLLTARKAVDYIQRELAQKRGGSKQILSMEVVTEADMRSAAWQPLVTAEIHDETERLLALLPDDDCRRIVQWKIEGRTHVEIAQMLDCSLRTVERKLRLIRAFWAEEFPE